MTHLGPFNSEIDGSLDPFQRDAKCVVKPAGARHSQSTSGPPRNPLLSQLDGSVSAKDMLRWATILSTAPNGMPAVVVVYLAFVYYYATRASAAWCSAHAKKFSKNVRTAVEAMFPKFGDVIIARAVKEPMPWSFRSGARDGRPSCMILAEIAGLKRAVNLPEDGANIVTYVEINEYAALPFRGYMQRIVQHIGCAEAIGYACVSTVKPWFDDPDASEAEVRRLQQLARKAGMKAILQPLLGLRVDIKRPIGIALWAPILQVRAPPCPIPDLRRMQIIKAAQLFRACTPKRGHVTVLPGLDTMTEHMLKRVIEAGRAWYGTGPNQIMWMARITGMTSTGLSDTGTVFTVLGNIVMTTAFTHVMALLTKRRLRIDLYPASSRSAVTKAKDIAPFRFEWQALNTIPIVTGSYAEVRINRAEAVTWEFLHLAAERGARCIRLIGMTAVDSTSFTWNSLVSGEFADLVGDQIKVHNTLLTSKYTSTTDVHEAVRKESLDVTVAKHVLPETIPVLCKLRGTALPTRPKYIATAAATMEELQKAFAATGMRKRHVESIAASADGGAAKRPCASE